MERLPSQAIGLTVQSVVETAATVVVTFTNGDTITHIKQPKSDVVAVARSIKFTLDAHKALPYASAHPNAAFNMSFFSSGTTIFWRVSGSYHVTLNAAVVAAAGQLVVAAGTTHTLLARDSLDKTHTLQVTIAASTPAPVGTPVGSPVG